jgi:hypothetical protein
MKKNSEDTDDGNDESDEDFVINFSMLLLRILLL